MRKKWMIYLLAIFMSVSSTCIPVNAQSKTLILELDPGHGGVDSGAVAEWFGDTVYEKDLNLRLAQYLKKELEQYEGVSIQMTRMTDVTCSLPERIQKTEEDQADALISLHHNASGTITDYDNGSSILVASGNLRPSLATEGEKLGSQIVEELSKIGLENQGLLKRLSETHTTYPNGSLADYYYLIKRAVEGNYVGIIVEHAFLDHGVDYKQYIRGDEKLRRMAEADAKGIARYYGLQKPGQKPMEPLRNLKEKITLVGGKSYMKTYYSQETKNVVTKKKENETFFKKFHTLIRDFIP